MTLISHTEFQQREVDESLRRQRRRERLARPEIGSEAWVREQIAAKLPPEEIDRPK